MQITEIKTKLSSNDVNILKQSLSFVTEKLSVERLRSSRAETRATNILAVVGILVGFFIYFSKLIGSPDQNNWVILFIIYITSILFLLKSVLFAIKALWTLLGYELNPDLVYNLQKLSKIDALREEIAWKIWEYYELLKTSNKRLFLVNRAQRNMFAAIVASAFLGVGWFFLEQMPIQVPKCVVIFLIVLLPILAIFSDVVLERFGKKWHFIKV
ncbi:hypothetical protein ES703_114290 [subsurface metagenome]